MYKEKIYLDLPDVKYLPYLDETSMGKATWISNAKAEDQLMATLGHYTIMHELLRAHTTTRPCTNLTKSYGAMRKSEILSEL